MFEIVNNKGLCRILIVVASLVLFLFYFAGCDIYNGPGSGEERTIGEKEPELDLPDSDDELSPHREGEVIIGFEDSADREDIIDRIEGEMLEEIKPLSAARVKMGDGRGIVDTVEELTDLSGVDFVQPNFYYEIIKPVAEKESYSPVDSNSNKIQTAAINAPDLESIQYGPQQINAPAAWEAGITGEGVVIAVIDSGVDPEHPEFSGKLLSGWNFPEGNDEFSDKMGHGTHVAGIAAAPGNNGIGMAGVAWDAEVLPINVDDGGEGMPTEDVASAILLSADPEAFDENEVDSEDMKPADVINMSLGYYIYSPLIQEAIDYALNEGVVVVCAMGNDFKRIRNYPAANEGVIAVGATGPRGEKVDFSSTGRHISVSAPGENVYSTVPVETGYEYVRMSGTSMASPFVAGAVALILGENPDLTPSEVKRLLEETADPGDFNMELGYGEIDVAAALEKGTPATLYGEIVASLKLPEEVELKKAELTLLAGEEPEGNRLITDQQEKVFFYDLLPDREYELRGSLETENSGDIYVSETGIEVKAGETTEVEIDE